MTRSDSTSVEDVILNVPGSDQSLPSSPVCSAKGCRADAVWVLAWNNPKLHTPERRKTWLACEEHRDHLSKFLGVRGFLKDVVLLTEWQSESGSESGSASGSAERPTDE
ncbi:hypothetical protein ACFYXC_22235 [Streptomyces sp. NPDC002701]|uniref:hypothetical protein n=1 Tax=Streptomyces sp. NPDC002701 TaxID=3364661 RepID=UPI00369B97A0